MRTTLHFERDDTWWVGIGYSRRDQYFEGDVLIEWEHEMAGEDVPVSLGYKACIVDTESGVPDSDSPEFESGAWHDLIMQITIWLYNNYHTDEMSDVLKRKLKWVRE